MPHDQRDAAQELIAYYEAAEPIERRHRKVEVVLVAALAVCVIVLAVQPARYGLGTASWACYAGALASAVYAHRIAVLAHRRRQAWAELTVAVIHAHGVLDAESVGSAPRPGVSAGHR